MSEIKKSTLHPYNDKDIDIYPKTNEEQVKDLKRYTHYIYCRFSSNNRGSFNVILKSESNTPITSVSQLLEAIPDDMNVVASGVYTTGGRTFIIEYAVLDKTNNRIGQAVRDITSTTSETQILTPSTIDTITDIVY